MGEDKSLLKIGTQRIIDIQLTELRKIAEDIILVTNSPQKYQDLAGIRLVRDKIPGGGPLSGIHSGLLESAEFHNFILASDMPFINVELVKFMYAEAPGYDVVVPRISGRYEPLFCIYSKNCIKYIQQMLERKNSLKIVDFFPLVKVREISSEQIEKFGPAEKIFFNINSREDLQKLNAESLHSSGS
jgi:molybdopterin-guanine dinucleotide biosynthesis protein A